MTTMISMNEVNEHIEKVLLLLKKQKYTPKETALTKEERKKIYDLFFRYSELIEQRVSIFDEDVSSKEEIIELNKNVFESMDEETISIISRCGVDPKEIFFVAEGSKFSEMNKKLYDSIRAYGVAKVDELTIEVTRDYPIDIKSPEIRSFHKNVKQEMVEKYEDGAATFRVYQDKNGKKTQIYCHLEDMEFGGNISFMGKQIGGNFGMNGFRFSGASGMMNKDEGVAIYIDYLMPFFDYFENQLSQRIIEEKDKVNVMSK